MRVKVPCKDCTRRKLGCHGRCPEYAEYREAAEELQRLRAAENDIVGHQIRSAVRCKMAARRGGKGKIR